MKRRDFFTLIGGAAAWPFAAQATGNAADWMLVTGLLASGSTSRVG
jgi:hypothetical protein